MNNKCLVSDPTLWQTTQPLWIQNNDDKKKLASETSPCSANGCSDYRHNPCKNWIEFELNGIWVRALPGPMHLGLKTGPLCPVFCTKLDETCSFGPQYLISWYILRVQKEGTQMCMSEWNQGLTLTQNMDSNN